MGKLLPMFNSVREPQISNIFKIRDLRYDFLTFDLAQCVPINLQRRRLTEAAIKGLAPARRHLGAQNAQMGPSPVRTCIRIAIEHRFGIRSCRDEFPALGCDLAGGRH